MKMRLYVKSLVCGDVRDFARIEIISRFVMAFIGVIYVFFRKVAFFEELFATM